MNYTFNFCTQNENCSHYDIQELLEDIMDEEFESICDDNSITGMLLQLMCLANVYQVGLRILQKSLPVSFASSDCAKNRNTTKSPPSWPNFPPAHIGWHPSSRYSMRQKTRMTAVAATKTIRMTPWTKNSLQLPPINLGRSRPQRLAPMEWTPRRTTDGRRSQLDEDIDYYNWINPRILKFLLFSQGSFLRFNLYYHFYL